MSIDRRDFVKFGAVTALGLALHQKNRITLKAFEIALSTMKEGMTNTELSGRVAAAHQQLGARGGAMVLFAELSASPHGTVAPQKLRHGDIVLVFYIPGEFGVRCEDIMVITANGAELLTGQAASLERPFG